MARISYYYNVVSHAFYTLLFTCILRTNFYSARFLLFTCFHLPLLKLQLYLVKGNPPVTYDPAAYIGPIPISCITGKS